MMQTGFASSTLGCVPVVGASVAGPIATESRRVSIGAAVIGVPDVTVGAGTVDDEGPVEPSFVDSGAFVKALVGAASVEVVKDCGMSECDVAEGIELAGNEPSV